MLDRPRDAAFNRPEVDRGALRHLLIGWVSQDAIRRGRTVSSVRAVGEGQYDIEFADGTQITAGLLVGADGAWSKVRPLLSYVRPN